VVRASKNERGIDTLYLMTKGSLYGPGVENVSKEGFRPEQSTVRRREVHIDPSSMSRDYLKS